MAASKVQLIGGVFQDAEGNVLANGYLKMVLSQDGNVSGVGQICSGQTIKVTLNANGSVDQTSAQSVWGNDQMTPVNSYYRVTGYTAAGQAAWGPNNQQVFGNGGTFDVGTWVPNVPISWTPQTIFPTLETNGAKNTLQSLLNLIAGSNVTLTADGAGGVTIAATAPTTVTTATQQHQALVNGTNTAWSTTWQLFTSGQIFGNNPVNVGPSGSQPRYLSQDSSIGVTQPAYVRESTLEITTGILNSWIMKSKITPLNNSPVFWAGVTDNPPSGGLGVWDTLTPAANFVGFRLFHPETTWKCVCQTDATHQTVVDSGVAADTNFHKFAFKVSSSGTVVTFFIDGVQVGVINTNIPATSVAMLTFVFAYEDSVSLPNITLSWASFYWDTLF